MNDSLNILFEWETFREEDYEWTALFVKVNNKWYMADTTFGTEDQEKIIEIIYNGNREW